MPSVADVAALARDSGLGRVHMLAWRDLADPEAGGSELHADRVARVWAEAGIEVTLRTSAASGLAPVEQRGGYRVIRRGGRLSVFARAPAAEVARLHGPRDAVVEIWNGVPFWCPLWTRGPRAVWLHYPHTELWEHATRGGISAAAGRFVEGRLAPPLYRRTEVVTLSEPSRQRLVREFGLSPGRISVVPPGVDPHFRAGAPTGRADDPLVVAVGRLTSYKRFDHVISAVHRLRVTAPAHSPAARARLVIAGVGDQHPRLAEQVVSLDARGWCRLAGRVDNTELADLYRRAWVLVSASQSEGWGMTVTEAAACATPAVVSDVGGHRDAVDDGQTGHLFGDHEQFVTLLRRVVQDEAHRARLGAAAAARSARLTWERTAFETLRVLAGRNGP